MAVEGKYDFRRRLDEVHRPGRRDASAWPAAGDVVIDETWSLVVAKDAPPLLLRAAQDLQDYFLRSMGLLLPLRPAVAPGVAAAAGPVIEISLDNEGGKARGYLFSVTAARIAIAGHDPAGAFMGAIYLEDLLNLRQGPFLAPRQERREPLFSPRMVHSGWGLDQFPDSHLNAIAHAGFDAILVFVKGPNCTTHGFMDFNNLIARAASYALDVYFYSYLPSFKHPDEPDAEAFFEENFGQVFARSPGARGLILVGESAQFPSRDPHSSGKDLGRHNLKWTDIADPRPSPGFWPCRDYPQWLEAVQRAVRKYRPDADIVFWTYNWGRAPEKYRLELVRNLPREVTLEATFEMFETLEFPRHTMVQPDYSITFPGPGRYFSSEAACARECGLRLYAMANTAGMTWDFGLTPYVPAPQQWFKRYAALHAARRDWNLSGLMDCHHYGWFPSPVAECAKWSFWDAEADLPGTLRQILVRDFGAEAAEDAMAGYQAVSDAMAAYTPGFDDQSGPLRCGPAYPFIFHTKLYPHVEHNMQFPVTPESTVGGRWIQMLYHAEMVYGQSWQGRRIYEDIKTMTAAKAIWERGVALMQAALAKTPPHKREQAELLAGVCEFCYRTYLTMLHTKRWWLLNKRLEIEYDEAAAHAILDEMEAVIDAERANAVAALPLVRRDSRLGWEPSMDYISDAPHIEWKLRQIDNRRQNTLPRFRCSVGVGVTGQYTE